jgi:predicted small metal-binding protein
MKTMTCPCGQQVTGETDEEFVENVNRHLQESHPDMAGKYTPEQILSRAQEA